MIKNLKYRLGEFFASRRVRMGGIAFSLAFTVAAVTLYGCPIHAVDILARQQLFTLNRGINSFANYAAPTPEASAFPVYITYGEQTTELKFAGGTVSEALMLAGIEADGDDFTEPSLDTVINGTIYIDYTKIDYVSSSYREAISYDTQTVYDSSKDKGYSEITQNGINGEREVFYTQKLVNGISTETTVTSSTVLTNPQHAIKVVGTKVQEVITGADAKTVSTLAVPFQIELDANGNPVNYKSKTVVRATAYTHTGNRCSTGVWPQPGYIAVNPKVIPYGTKMYIKSPDGSIVYGYAVAADTGGFIRNYPNGIDLFMSTRAQCINFGVRNMEVYILE